MAAMFLIGIIEGIGVTLFLPVLQNGFGEDKLSRILEVIFGYFNVKFSFKLLLLLIVIFFIFRAVLVIFYERYFDRLISNLMVKLRQRILNKVFAVDYLCILRKQVGYINNVIVREIACVVDAFKNFTEVLRGVAYLIMYLTLSLLLNFGVTMVAICASPIVFIFMKRINSLISKLSRNTTLSYGRYHSLLIQCLSKLKYLKATDSYSKTSKIIEKESKELGNLRFQMSFLQALTKNMFEPVLVFAVVTLLFYYVAVLKKDVSKVMFLIFLFVQVARQFLDNQAGYRKFLASVGSIEIFNNFEDELNRNKENLHLDGAAPDFGNIISFNDVTVIFPNGKKALDRINMTIRPRSVVAFVGHSGSGKSTIANMITGIIKPTSGEIRFGGTPYQKINLEALRRHTGYVTQEDIIFNANIKNNISLWDENPDEGRLRTAAEIAHMADFLKGLPNGYDAMLGDNGLDISGGQRQRITIARELYKDAQLLILDEATSSLDAKYEKAIYENLKGFKGQKTMVVIAHRLSTIKNADYIYVMDEGRIVEEGTFEDLSNDKETKFYQICQLQSV